MWADSVLGVLVFRIGLRGCTFWARNGIGFGSIICFVKTCIYIIHPVVFQFCVAFWAGRWLFAIALVKSQHKQTALSPYLGFGGFAVTIGVCSQAIRHILLEIKQPVSYLLGLRL